MSQASEDILRLLLGWGWHYDLHFGLRFSFFDDARHEASRALMFLDMPVNYASYRHDRDSEKNTRNAGDLFTRENG